MEGISGYDAWKTRTPDEDLPLYGFCHVCQERHYTDEMICTEEGYICEASILCFLQIEAIVLICASLALSGK